MNPTIAAYDQFLRSKIVATPERGISIEAADIHPFLKPHQRAIVHWALKKGCAALFEAFGLGKTVQQLEIARHISRHCCDAFLIVAPLGVRQEFRRDAERLGLDITFIRETAEAKFGAPHIYLTNYESVREGKIDPRKFAGASLDEAAILRGFGGTKTFREFMRLFENGQVRYKFVATATPSPNEYIELLAYAAFLDVMDVSQAKTRFFKRDSTKADNLTLHANKEREFWLWVASWAIFLQSPEDLGFDGSEYRLPELEVIWHELPSDHTTAPPEKGGQGRLIRSTALGVTHAAREKKDSLKARVEKVRELAAATEQQFIIWCDRNDEQRAIDRILEPIASFSSLYGDQSIEARENLLAAWKNRDTRVFVSKPVMYGAGVNLQQCSTAIYAGIGFKFAEFIQSVHRIYRFLQSSKVRIHLIYTEAEREVRRVLEEKWAKHNELVAQMSAIIRQYGLATNALEKEFGRSLGVERTEASGQNWKMVHSDAVLETASMPDASVHLVLSSIPFCYDDKTEVLTARGWKIFGEVKSDDVLATVHPKKLCFEWQTPSRIVWELYSGEMLAFGNRCFDLLVTPNHGMFAARRGKSFSPEKLSTIQAEAIARDYEFSKRKKEIRGRILRGWRTCLVPPNPGVGCWPSKIDIPPLPENVKTGHGVQLYWVETKDFMELAGWYLSEGHADSFTSTRSGGRVSIAQVKNEKYRQEIRDLFTRIGLPPSDHSRQISAWCRNLAYFLIHQFGSSSKQKSIPRWVLEMHPQLLTVLRDTMMKGDGARNLTSYTSYSPTLRDGFQELCLKTGWRATIKGNYVKVGTKQIYPEIRSAPKRTNYSGMIGCATVPNGLLVVRRNGKPCISGNSTQYEYSPSYNDFGHTDSNEQFWEQMGFLIPELLRVLQPGRCCLIHVKDRIVPGGLNGMGFQTAYPFHCDAIRHFQRGGFAYLGMKTIVTDVVRENNQTYRLGWTEQCKDGSRMGVGMPEYLLMFRKPPTDSSKGYADVPVVKSKTEYSRSRWQIDAHGFARSSGNRILTPEDLNGVPHERIFKMFREFSLKHPYDFERHVALSESLETCQECSHIHIRPDRCDQIIAAHAKGLEDPNPLKCECRGAGRLPVTFMLLQPQSWHEDVWTDITRMLSLNSAQSASGREMHLCPMQFDLADRAIAQFTMRGETVYDPFGGLGTVPLRAIKQGRKGIACELAFSYWRDACFYLEAEERKMATPTLFDLLRDEEPATLSTCAAE